MSYFEPWYECETIKYKDVVEALTYCLKGKIFDKELLSSLIKEVVPVKQDFGSIRGYYTLHIHNIKTK